MKRHICLSLCIFLVAICLSVSAQDSAAEEKPQFPDTGVWVTTQDLSSFRKGPGKNFERITVIPESVTLPAIGRTTNSTWVQVVYQDQAGWISAGLLVWSGEFINLKIDGYNPAPYIRRTELQANIKAGATLYSDSSLFYSAELGTVPEDAPVELTGRLGNGVYMPFQVIYQGKLYWVGSWDLFNVRGGSIFKLLDMTYRYAYGRITNGLSADISRGLNRLSTIESYWLDLQAGRIIRCDRLPDFLPDRRTPDSDINQEPQFRLMVNALDTAIDSTNIAISLLDDACNRTNTFITPTDIQTALTEIDNARRNYNLAQSIFGPLNEQNPFTS